MAIVGILVQETTTTTGTGDLTTASVNGKRSFNTEFGNGATTNVFYYYISHQSAAEWEFGTGHMSAASTLVRDTVISSSNSNNAVNFSAGTKDVVNDMSATGQMLQLNTGTASITVSHSDMGKIVELTGSTARTFTFTASANLGNGWWCITKNSSTAELTLDGNASELDGLANYISYPGEARLLQCTGSVINSTVLHGFTYLNTASYTFTTPPGYKLFEVELWAGGGAGGKGTTTAGGGGGGAYVSDLIPSGNLAATVTVTVGAGGIAQTTADTNGNVGGNTTFGAHLTSYGGGAGGGAASPGHAGGAKYVTASATIPTLVMYQLLGSASVQIGGTNSNSGSGGQPNGGRAAWTDGTNASSMLMASKDGGGAGGIYLGTTGASGLTQSYYTDYDNIVTAVNMSATLTAMGGSSINGGGGGGGGSSTTVSGAAGGSSINGGAGGGGGGMDAAPGPSGGGLSLRGGAGGAGATGAATATTGSVPSGGGGGSVTGTSGAGGAGQTRVSGWT